MYVGLMLSSTGDESWAAALLTAPHLADAGAALQNHFLCACVGPAVISYRL
jgi:hypothetical protein